VKPVRSVALISARTNSCDMAQQNLFASERAVLRVEPADVIMKLRVARTWAGNDYLAGGRFTVVGYTLNRRATGTHAQLQTYVNNTFPIGHAGDLARPEDGGGALQPRIRQLVERYSRL
jgi:hypothetical protein